MNAVVAACGEPAEPSAQPPAELNSRYTAKTSLTHPAGCLIVQQICDFDV
jgi:hypothetical protein